MKCQKKKLLRDYLEGYGAEAIQKIEVETSVSGHIVYVKLCFYMKSIFSVIPVQCNPSNGIDI